MLDNVHRKTAVCSLHEVMHVAGQYDGTNPSKSAVADASITNHACFFSANLAACRPEVNQRISKAAHIKELNSEIDKLKEELFATREKNGVYLPADHWESQQVVILVMLVIGLLICNCSYVCILRYRGRRNMQWLTCQ